MQRVRRDSIHDVMSELNSHIAFIKAHRALRHLRVYLGFELVHNKLHGVIQFKSIIYFSPQTNQKSSQHFFFRLRHCLVCLCPFLRCRRHLTILVGKLCWERYKKKITLMEKKGICRTSEQLTETHSQKINKSANFADYMYSPNCSPMLASHLIWNIIFNMVTWKNYTRGVRQT
jgi:hypothetical protein